MEEKEAQGATHTEEYELAMQQLVSAQTLAQAMLNAVTAQQQAQIEANAMVAEACAKILSGRQEQPAKKETQRKPTARKSTKK